MDTLFFNAHHSPIGAFASFTLGFPGASGGIGQELGQPANQNVYIGMQDATTHTYQALPFFDESENKLDDFASLDVKPMEQTPKLKAWEAEVIQRKYTLASDKWTVGDMSFEIISPAISVPDPSSLTDEAALRKMQQAIVPCVLIEVTIDNRNSETDRTAFFGYEGNDPYSAMRFTADTEQSLVGIAQGQHTAIISCDDNPMLSVEAANGLTIEQILHPEHDAMKQFGIGTVSALLMHVKAKSKQVFRFAVCFHKAGNVTSGMPSRYFYNRYFETLEQVGLYAKHHWSDLSRLWLAENEALETQSLSSDQAFMLAHATKSYYGSTQLLEQDGKALWVVNEGEYRMMNTFDLTADHLFYELKSNPWVVKNVLDLFISRYSYHDNVHQSNQSSRDTARDLHVGGLSFCHDMGVANVFSKPGHSSYEVYDHHGLFSHMTCEQLVNWLCCAGTYVLTQQDWAWAKKNDVIFKQCFTSMLNRDNPDASKRDGVMSFDSDRCLSEITTYDSLDISLGQANRNGYLATKSWSSYILLQAIFNQLNEADLAQHAAQQAKRCAQTLVSSLDKGYIPAVLDGHNQSKIIPVIEGLVFPYVAGCQAAVDLTGEYGEFLTTLNTHLSNVLEKGDCLFKSGGWKLSSTSNNSWLSKIYLCQFVARHILNNPHAKNTALADKVHASWLLDDALSYWAWSDQIVAGKITASKYYPRGVTAWLWLNERA